MGAVTVRESEYSADERALLIASRRYEKSLGPHGYPMDEATDPANQFKFLGSEGPLVDWVEKARLDAQDAYLKLHDRKNNPVNRNGWIFTVKKRGGGSAPR